MDRRISLLIASGLLATVSACSLGPRALESSRGQYNEAIRMTRDQQLLLNLIRLKYRDAPSFLDVSSIASQFVIDQDVSAIGTINEGGVHTNPNALELDAGLLYSDRPTITYSPLAGEKFVKQMMTPLSMDTMVLLTGSGWSADRVFRVAVQEINGLDNAHTASGPTPEEAPPFEQFAAATALLRELQQSREVSLGFEARRVVLSEPIPASEIKATDVLAAAKEGYRFEKADEGSYVLTTTKPTPVMQITEKGRGSEAVRELLQALRLKPGQSQYDIVVTDRSPPASDELQTSILIAPRSLLGAMFYLSQCIEVPKLHRDIGLVTITRDAEGREFDWGEAMGDLLRIRSSLTPPIASALQVRYLGYYFYIDAADLTSRTTFTLLVQLFELQAGQEASGGPVLTIPVGG